MYKAFFKWDGKGGARALWGVTMIQILTVSEVIWVTMRIFFTHQQLKPFGKEIAWSFVIIGFIFFILNNRKYSGQFDGYDSKWKNESENKKVIKGAFVVFSLVIPWILFVLMANLIG
jgi:hypothetical protein